MGVRKGLVHGGKDVQLDINEYQDLIKILIVGQFISSTTTICLSPPYKPSNCLDKHRIIITYIKAIINMW